LEAQQKQELELLEKEKHYTTL
jgi:hypothetical protein